MYRVLMVGLILFLALLAVYLYNQAATAPSGDSVVVWYNPFYWWRRRHWVPEPSQKPLGPGGQEWPRPPKPQPLGPGGQEWPRPGPLGPGGQELPRPGPLGPGGAKHLLESFSSYELAPY